MKGFIEFVKKQGVVGLAVGFVLGGSVSNVVTALTQDIINPLLSVVLGSADSMANLSLNLNGIQIGYGHFLATFIDFIVLALVVYFVVTVLKLDETSIKKK